MVALSCNHVHVHVHVHVGPFARTFERRKIMNTCRNVTSATVSVTRLRIIDKITLPSIIMIAIQYSCRSKYSCCLYPRQNGLRANTDAL